jgi:hypothetical protein
MSEPTDPEEIKRIKRLFAEGEVRFPAHVEAGVRAHEETRNSGLRSAPNHAAFTAIWGAVALCA